MLKLRIISILLVMTFFLSGCITKSISQKGFIFDDEDLSNISVGLTNKENVLKYLGYPLNKSYFNDNLWIYYSYETKEVLFFKPKIQKQKVLIIEFDKVDEIVKNMSVYNIDTNNSNLDDIDFKDDYDKNVLKDIFKNIGQVGLTQ